jgi:hypothetical protein
LHISRKIAIFAVDLNKESDEGRAKDSNPKNVWQDQTFQW